MTAPAVGGLADRYDAVLLRWWRQLGQRAHGNPASERPPAVGGMADRYDAVLLRRWRQRRQHTRSGM